MFDTDEQIWKEQDGSVDTKNNSISGYSQNFGYFTISGELSNPNNGVIKLLSGWNFISTAKKLEPGYDTAYIFSGVDTAGHSFPQY